MSMSRRMAVCASLLLASLLSCGTPAVPKPLQTGAINLLLGDASFQARFGRPPNAHDNEDLRIRVHLEFVLELLRQRPTTGRSPVARAARARQLERLAAYIHRGEFPRNDGHPDARRPTFIDSRGRICAVGYLLEQELGRAAAEAIAAEYKYAFIRELDSPLLARWADATGLTREELELIQPSYSDTREGEFGALFSLLEQADGRGHLSFASGLLFDGRGDGVPVRLEVSLAVMGTSMRGSSYGGLYADVSLTKLTGASRAASALSNLELGGAWAQSAFAGRAWLVVAAGVLLPTGDEDEVGLALNDAMAAQRPARAVLFQPGALGGRLGFSMILPEAPCDACSLRLDAGLDGYRPFARGFQLSPRWGAGLAYHSSRPFVATLEVAGARYAEASSSSISEFHHSVGGSIRYLWEGRPSFQPGLSLSMPLEGRLERAFVGLDLAVRH